jgi:hypothetical protein
MSKNNEYPRYINDEYPYGLTRQTPIYGAGFNTCFMIYLIGSLTMIIIALIIIHIVVRKKYNCL